MASGQTSLAGASGGRRRGRWRRVGPRQQQRQLHHQQLLPARRRPQPPRPPLQLQQLASSAANGPPAARKWAGRLPTRAPPAPRSLRPSSSSSQRYRRRTLQRLHSRLTHWTAARQLLLGALSLQARSCCLPHRLLPRPAQAACPRQRHMQTRQQQQQARQCRLLSCWQHPRQQLGWRLRPLQACQRPSWELPLAGTLRWQTRLQSCS